MCEKHFPEDTSLALYPRAVPPLESRRGVMIIAQFPRFLRPRFGHFPLSSMAE
jgi:hypothetical protein